MQLLLKDYEAAMQYVKLRELTQMYYQAGTG